MKTNNLTFRERKKKLRIAFPRWVKLENNEERKTSLKPRLSLKMEDAIIKGRRLCDLYSDLRCKFRLRHRKVLKHQL